jgi:hypothetical protein
VMVSGMVGNVLTGVNLSSGSYTMTDNQSTKVVTQLQSPPGAGLAQAVKARGARVQRALRYLGGQP